MTRPDPGTLLYAGIGSRETPAPVLKDMTTMSSWLARTGWHLASGGANGADTAFAAGAPPTQRTIYLPWQSYNQLSGPDCILPNLSELDACMDVAARVHPAWDRCSQRVRRLHARNAAILLGTSLDRPVNAVVAWTEGGAVKGGTGLGLRIAAEYDIPVLNLGSISPRETAERLQAIRHAHQQAQIGQHIHAAGATARHAPAEDDSIEFTEGDIFSQSAEAIVNPVNCVGVMGRGLALQFRERYPDAFEAYRAACEDQRLRPGRVFLYETGLQQPRWIVHFPTKRHWRDPSVMSDIEAGLGDLAKTIERNNIRSIAIPALGSGLGGLDWNDVRPLLAARLAATPAAITVLEPRSLAHSRTADDAAEPPSPSPPQQSANQYDSQTYQPDQVCGFRYTRAQWGEFSNFSPLATPISAGPWTFATSEHLYQAAKFGPTPETQARIAAAASARQAASTGRTSNGVHPNWNSQRVDVMRWVIRMKREANPEQIDALLVQTGDRPIVEISARDAFWGALPVRDTYQGANVLGRLWTELRDQLSNDDPAAHSAAWLPRIEIGPLSSSHNTRETTAPALRLASRVYQQDNGKMQDDKDTDVDLENDQDIDLGPPGADTATVTQHLELYSATPSRDESDSRIVWDEDDGLYSLGEAIQIIVQGITVEGTQLADEREPIMWGFVNVLDSQVTRLDGAVDRIFPELRDLQKDQDGSEIKANELELLTDRSQSFGDRRDAFEKMRDLAEEAYRAETGQVWRPRHGSHISRSNSDTPARIDARDYRNAQKQKQLHPHLYAGTVIALAGGKDVPDPDAVRDELDQQLSRHPDMVLAHGGAPGVEKIGGQWAEAKGVKQYVCLPNWKRHEKAAPFRRNEEIVKLKPKVLIAFPGSGITKNLVGKAREAGIPIISASLTATIFNLKTHPDAVENGAIRIDRETEWRNPFKVGEHGSREEVIARYKKDLWKRIDSGDMPLAHLAALKGRDLACGPDDCHGEVLVNAATWAADELAKKATQEMTAASADHAQKTSTQTTAHAGDRSQRTPSPTTPDTSETPSTSDAASTKNRTEATPDHDASEPRTTVTDEPDGRVAWDREDALAALREVIRIIIEDITIEGTQMADEREPLLWGFTNMLHAQMQRIERSIKQDGKELEDLRDAFKEMRNLAAEAYRAETGRHWQPRQPSHTSKAATVTQAARDAQDYMDSLKKQKIDDHLPQGSLIALSGGKTVTDPDAVWNELDRALARKPDMILLHGNAPGVEKIGARWAEAKDITQVVCLPNWKLHEKAAPFRRNQEIINLGPKELIAFPGSGITDNLVDKATQAGIPVINASLSATISADRSSHQPDPERQARILNLKEHPYAVKNGAIRIDRETRWKNPFEIGQNGSREEVTTLYANDLWRRIRSGDVPLADLAALNGKNLACASNDCHGHVLASAATWAAGHLARKASEHIPSAAADQGRQDPIQNNSAASDQIQAAPSTAAAEPSQAPALSPPSQASVSTTQTDGPAQMHAPDSFAGSLQQFMANNETRNRQAHAAGIDRVHLPGLEQHAHAAAALAEHPNYKDIPTDTRFSLSSALDDQKRYDHAIAETDDICKRMGESLSRYRHLEHLARIGDVDISKVESYQQWLTDAGELSARGENMIEYPDEFDCGFTPAKWQEFSERLLALDTAIGDHDSFFVLHGHLHLEPLPLLQSASEEALQVHASYRQLRNSWHDHIREDGGNQIHPYEEVSPKLMNTMHHLSQSTHLPDSAKQAVSELFTEYSSYRNAFSEVETYLQNTQQSLDTNIGFHEIMLTRGHQKVYAEDLDGYQEWQDQATKLVRTGEKIVAEDSSTCTLYLKNNPDLKDKLETSIDNLKNTLENALPSRTQEIAQHQQLDQHRSISRGVRM